MSADGERSVEHSRPPMKSRGLQSTPDVPTRWCPACRELLLEPVDGGLGPLGRCSDCGYTGSLERRERRRETAG